MTMVDLVNWCVYLSLKIGHVISCSAKISFTLSFLPTYCQYNRKSVDDKVCVTTITTKPMDREITRPSH